MNVQGNLYTFIYASVLVILVAAGLSFTAIKLQPIQEKNIEIEKKQNILSSVGIANTPENAEELYAKYITDSYSIDTKGSKKEGVDAFSIKLKKEFSLAPEEMSLPVFVCTQDDGSKNIIIPLLGKGLWGPVWGYISLKNDMNTIFGAVFAHKGETPGLGAEIATPEFQKTFVGKKLFSADGTFKSITLYKGGKGSAVLAGDIDHGVDAISGGTITSKGVEAMLRDNLSLYKDFLKSNAN